MLVTKGKTNLYTFKLCFYFISFKRVVGISKNKISKAGILKKYVLNKITGFQM